ncbi:phosphatidylglycerophosphatase A [Undibacterium sp. RTI2.1]|uniref:phosphatidylglycerophosphatase A family protein n=1 Tax=unclassified Undibacterium TaxID=2630295 RepID=UPI002AB3508B|nr:MULTISPECIES: phosphatidylglycerophosphatase A [unclassified Undibacterium]MDY7538697.1 phosphatidylglycerophosphatase A [Undibacterium sp. 5I1]MEB0030247.1 phosphatidylglycerophosphatase A [Undibacterium sp. RTI2.1]MEB0116871.1 phosphatidylglycerophosphatase A [Undibacterium sp. RTI2.2]MEB0229636.1 phosphatidylglycerophosphatase A [Undibacterium sp. 10I3]MEB0259085.1 phosphatidylglycerophosphatase A [Undibacterium sp. 5I1]
MLSHPAHILAQGFGSGLSPIMPGTSGTLFAWLSFNVLSTRWPDFFTPSSWAWIIVLGFVVGVWACQVTGRNMGVADHGSMVWDEIIAFWLVLLFVTPASFSTQCWAFFWFRVFDMVKPPPIGYFDRQLKGGFGVMWDDILAAFYTLLLFALWRVI